MQSPLPLTRDLVLIGGGHTHALVLRQWGMNPLPGVRLTLIDPHPSAPYSGMLPGHIAGHYARRDLEIDLVKLARFAGARLILGRAEGLDMAAREVHVPGRPPVRYDIAALDIGVTSRLPQLPGFAEHALAAKPLGRFADHWESFAANPPAEPHVVVLGAGVAGVELAMACAHRLGEEARVTVVEAGVDILAGMTPHTRAALADELAAQGITVELNARAARIAADHVALEDGRVLRADVVIGATGARPQGWLTETGLALVEGFIAVDTQLRSLSDDRIYAAGDCAHMGFAPRPKAGVYAVRQAPILLANLRADLTGKTRKRYSPQKDYLKLISTGRKAAIADKAGMRSSGGWLWRLKDRIDRKFMDKFHTLPAMSAPDLPRDAPPSLRAALGDTPLCGGCGAKVGASALDGALATLPAPQHPDTLSGPGDDAALLRHGAGQQVISTDHLRAFVEDPYLMTRITLQHALGDVWAMGAEPQAVLSQIILPRATPELHAGMLAEITAAAQEGVRAVGADLVGGHTSIGAELTLGFTVTGLVPEGRAAIGLAGARPGDRLVLSRPIGIGVLLAAEMQGAADGADIAALWATLDEGQAETARALARHAHAMTDVTGFGLAGHLARLCAASGVGATVSLATVPVFAGAEALAEQGYRSTIYPENRALLPDLPDQTARQKLLFDPQTAGGLLAAVPAGLNLPGVVEIGEITAEAGLRLSD
ncbi:selenide, water dikinase SelD [Dinoroseobacter sp. S124A]|uniref:selenide, water dikinase SelD n=1 Tax=Dinoroseobacter sp. S124A TaxID=3415128 RepID=UPI003C7C9C10